MFHLEHFQSPSFKIEGLYGTLADRKSFYLLPFWSHFYFGHRDELQNFVLIHKEVPGETYVEGNSVTFPRN